MYGKFIKNTAGFEITELNLPTSWEYIYENRDILLKVDQFGPIYAQAHPPGDIMLFKRETHEKYSPWVVNINEKFTNFFRPNQMPVGAEPKNLSIKFLPECAIYSFEYDDFLVSTEFFVPSKGTSIIMKFKLKNLSDTVKDANIKAHLVPYLNDAQIAPWDKFEWYLDTTSKKENELMFKTKLLSADAKSEKRRFATFASDLSALAGYETSLEKYIGQGDLSRPQFSYTNSNRIYGYPPIYATFYKWTLNPSEEKTLTQIITIDDIDCNYFKSSYFENKKQERKQEFDLLFSKNTIKTNDLEFDNYVNYWLPLQMNWVASLDRGWPTGMRGSRDSAQDYTALLYSMPENVKEIILTMLECQRKDGWFPRQYSTKGKYGKHDLRTHIDGGAFFVEFMWKYLAHTKDFDILNLKAQWLDDDEKSTVLTHLIRACEFYIMPENLGEHGLCKIYGGDWLDAVNTAGLNGRGESVTVSCQTVMSLKYLADILKKLDSNADTCKYLNAADLLCKNINDFAYNTQKFYNGVFNDDGKWIFSDNDPDGKCRMYGVSNYYAIISGVAASSKHYDILEAAKKLKCDKGYRLFYPCLGEKPIEKVGRIASGDVPPFLGENGNVYNHGSQGFLARAFAVSGYSNELFDALKWILPYDTKRHPTASVFTPPYAIVNCWQELPQFNHRGLMCFLTGSVAMAMRGVLEWLFGIKPTLDGLQISPCLPKELGDASVLFTYMNKSYSLKFKDDKIYLNDKELSEKRPDLITGKMNYFINL